MHVEPVEGLPEIRPGDDLAALLADAVDLDAVAVDLDADAPAVDGEVDHGGVGYGGVDPGGDAGDPANPPILCVASTIVSKAEGRQADLSDFQPSERAKTIAERIGAIAGEDKDPRFAEAVLAESEELVLEAPILLAVTRFGHVTVNAGIDRSNVPDADLLLLPEDPTASAERLHEALGVPVVVTDTSGRPFRQGQRGVALGWAGIPAARDWRGERDRDGRELGVTVQAVVDELAAAANLVTGEGAGGTPAAVIRDFEFGDHAPSEGLFRDPADDLVRAALNAWSFEADATVGPAGERSGVDEAVGDEAAGDEAAGDEETIDPDAGEDDAGPGVGADAGD